MPDLDAELQRRAAAVRRRETGSEPSADRSPEPHPLVRLQSQVGNAQVARLLAQRQEAPEEEELQVKHDPALLQRQGVPEEEEELQAKHDPALLQRQLPEEEEVQAKHEPGFISRLAEPVIGLEGGPLGDDLAGRIDAARGTGSGLSGATRNQMEPAFGADFSSVRVHQDPESDALARSMTARAFTTGADIFLRQDVNPGDTSLLAHELAHVVQQDSRVAGEEGGSGISVRPAGDPLEQQADSVAQAVVSGAGAQRRIEEGRPSPG